MDFSRDVVVRKLVIYLPVQFRISIFQRCTMLGTFCISCRAVPCHYQRTSALMALDYGKQDTNARTHTRLHIRRSALKVPYFRFYLCVRAAVYALLPGRRRHRLPMGKKAREPVI